MSVCYRPEQGFTMNSPHSILKNVPSLLANKEISINIWRQYRENVPFDVVIKCIKRTSTGLQFVLR